MYSLSVMPGIYYMPLKLVQPMLSNPSPTALASKYSARCCNVKLARVLFGERLTSVSFSTVYHQYSRRRTLVGSRTTRSRSLKSKFTFLQQLYSTDSFGLSRITVFDYPGKKNCNIIFLDTLSNFIHFMVFLCCSVMLLNRTGRCWEDDCNGRFRKLLLWTSQSTRVCSLRWRLSHASIYALPKRNA